MRLNNKTALITGATGGIGQATARRFLEEGAKVMAVGRSEQKLAALAEALGHPDRLATHVADATDEPANKAAVQATLERFGALDILFANAGTEGQVSAIEEVDTAAFRQLFETNVLGVWLVLKHAAPVMREGGSIMATSSIAGAVGIRGLAPYVASKHAVNGMVKTAALELGPRGIRVNAIGPGAIDNRMNDSLAEQFAPDAPDAAMEGFKQLVPMQRIGTNEEVANLAVFLASDEAAYCTGGVYMADGGFTGA